MNHELEDLREQINNIDSELLALITERASLLEQVVATKLKDSDGGPARIFVPEREQKIISRLMMENKSHLDNKTIANIFQSIINACRNFQITRNQSENEPLTISIQGIEGSYSEQAAFKFCRQKALLSYTLDYAVSSDNVLKQLSSGKVQYGIVALNNSQGGLVKETLDALNHHQYRIVDSVIVLVEHSLLALSNTKKEQIKNIYSHPQALRQCHQYLEKEYPHCKQIAWADTALSAVDLAAGKLAENSAVIAYSQCAKNNNLLILDESIQDLNDNETLFLVIKAPPENS